MFCVNNADYSFAERHASEDNDVIYFANLRGSDAYRVFDAKSHFKNAKAFRTCINDLDKSKFLDINL